MLLTFKPFVTPFPNWEDHKLSQSLAGLTCMRHAKRKTRQACVYPVKAPKNWSQTEVNVLIFRFFFLAQHSTHQSGYYRLSRHTPHMIHARSFLRNSLVAAWSATKDTSKCSGFEWLENRATGISYKLDGYFWLLIFFPRSYEVQQMCTTSLCREDSRE